MKTEQTSIEKTRVIGVFAHVDAGKTTVSEAILYHTGRIHRIGTIDAGDIMMVGPHFYIGITERTNREGAGQMIDILKEYGLTGSTVAVEKVLHLKTGVAYLENNILMASGEFLEDDKFKKFDLIAVDEDESYAGNSIWINDTVLTPSGYPKTEALLEKTGYRIVTLDMSEFRKLDGGLSCLSLRF